MIRKPLSTRGLFLVISGNLPFININAQMIDSSASSVKSDFGLTEILLIGLIVIVILLGSYILILRKKLKSQDGNGIMDDSLPENQLIFTLIDYMPDRIYIKDRKSRFIAGNINVGNVMGVKSPKELVGKTDFDFYAKDLAGEYFRDEQELMKSGISLINKEERGLDLDGNEIIVSTTKVPFKNDKGKIIGIIGIGRDITLQKINEGKLLREQRNLQEANTLLEERQEEIQ